MIRLAKRLPISMSIAAVSVVASASGAWADCNNTGNPPDVSWQQYYAGAGSQVSTWNANAGNGTSTLDVNTNNIGDNRCLDVWHDWATTGGHYDARVVRVCRDNGHRDNGNANGDYDEPNTVRTLTGQNRGGACVYSAYSFVGTCEQTPASARNSGCLVQDVADHAGNGVQPAVGSYETAMMWLRYADGSVAVINSNSDPVSASQ